MSRHIATVRSSYFLILSISGLIVLAALTFFTMPSFNVSPFQKPIVISIFVLICLTGMVAGISPSKCSVITSSENAINPATSSESSEWKGSVAVSGHHPDCGKFLTHTFRFGAKVHCAGCTGLVIGALLSILGSIAYLAISPQLEATSPILFWVGFIAICLALLEYDLLRVRNSYLHLIVNIGFVVGDFLILTGLFEMNNSPLLDAYFLTLTLLLIVTRIILSQAEHRRICEMCGRKDCDFK
jgi:hypothetical protein